MDIIAVDISGRHKLDDKYCMVCVAVMANVSPFHVEQITDMKIIKHMSDDVTIDSIAGIILRTCSRSDAIIVSEPGEFYNFPQWRVEAILGRKFKYAESIGERKAINIAHHVSLSVHRMLHAGDE